MNNLASRRQLHTGSSSSGIDRKTAHRARSTIATKYKCLRSVEVSSRAFNSVLMRHINQRPCSCREDPSPLNGAPSNWLLLGVAISSDDTHSLTDSKELTGFYAINTFVAAFK